MSDLYAGLKGGRKGGDLKKMTKRKVKSIDAGSF